MTNTPTSHRPFLVTGGAGFIASSFVRQLLSAGRQCVILDALTYAGHLANLSEVLHPENCQFVHGKIQDAKLLDSLFAKYQFQGVFNFAAESHVDNSISGPRDFIDTNIIGTFELLEASRRYWNTLSPESRQQFRFLHVSTDEVFGSLGAHGYFRETTPYAPNSPYSASKAASDHLVRAWYHTYGLPVITTNCSNNYGPRQFPEKLIPRMILNALNHNLLPVYGKGENIRDWIHVDDHNYGVWLAFQKGRPGETYCFGGNSERTNLAVVEWICQYLDKLRPKSDGTSYKTQIAFVTDRLGHDYRYAIDDTKAKEELGFNRKYLSFEDGLQHTIEWYLTHSDWINTVTNKES